MQLTRAQFEECHKEFIKLGEHALYLNHYQLALETNIEDPILWKAYLTEPKVVDYVSTEMSIIRTAAINEIVQKAPNSNSVGQAQLINALVKIDENSSKKEGPVFIYSYVPLNDEQKFAPNIKPVNSTGVDVNEDWINNEQFELTGISD